MSRTSTSGIIKFGTSSIYSATTASYCRTNDPIFGLASEIDEDIATEDALDINGDGGDRNVKGDEFELHMNANGSECSIEEDFIPCEGNVEKGTHKNFLKVKARGSMEVIGKIAVNNSSRFEGVKIPSTPDYYVP